MFETSVYLSGFVYLVLIIRISLEFIFSLQATGIMNNNSTTDTLYLTGFSISCLT